MKQKKSIRCPYYGGTAILRDASFVYGKKSYGGKVYVCSNYPRCDAYVGVHPGTRIPKARWQTRNFVRNGCWHIRSLTKSG